LGYHQDSYPHQVDGNKISDFFAFYLAFKSSFSKITQYKISSHWQENVLNYKGQNSKPAKRQHVC